MAEYANHIRASVNHSRNEVVINFAQECPRFDSTEKLTPEPISDIVMTADLARRLVELLNSLLDGAPVNAEFSEKSE